MKPSRDFQPQLVNYLKSPKSAAGYLTAAYEDGDREVFLAALRNVVEAHGGITKLARLSKLNREHLYTVLSKQGNPEIYTLGTILQALGFRLAILTESPKHKLRRAA